MDKNKLGNEPAFPQCDSVCVSVAKTGSETSTFGMSIRKYAAIELRVPDSGSDWLDEMIKKANRRDAACFAMQSIIQRETLFENNIGLPDITMTVREAYSYADEFLKQENE